MGAKKHDRWDATPRDLIVATREFFKERHAVRRSVHPYRDGTEGEDYADFDQIVSDPSRLKDVLDLLADRVDVIRRETPVDFLVFIDKGSSGYRGATVGAVVLASALSLKAYLPFVLVRLDRRANSERVKMPAIRGDDEDSLRGLNGLLVTDHIGAGDEAVQAIESIRYVGGDVSHVIAYTCRDIACRSRFEDEQHVEVWWAHDFPVAHATAGVK